MAKCQTAAKCIAVVYIYIYSCLENNGLDKYVTPLSTELHGYYGGLNVGATIDYIQYEFGIRCNGLQFCMLLFCILLFQCICHNNKYEQYIQNLV